MIASLYIALVAAALGWSFSSIEVRDDSFRYGLIGLSAIALAGTIPEKTFKVFIALLGTLILILGLVVWPIKAYLG